MYKLPTEPRRFKALCLQDYPPFPRCTPHKWVYGYYVRSPEGDIRPHAIWSYDYRFEVYDGGYGGSCFIQGIHRIDPNTLCMGTGVYDTHGTEIFENDIVADVDNRHYIVKYSRGAFVICPCDDSDSESYLISTCVLTIVENQFDHLDEAKL